jgi:mono/diheme cytochrome c family protein
MFRSPAVGSLTRTPRNQPAGTLSVHGVEPLSRQAAAKKLRNPLHATHQVLLKGQALFETYCTPCHGDDARGFGPVRYLLRVPPADLTHGMPVSAPDGSIYSTIRNGNHAMPPYGDTMSSNDTWAVILYVRELQRRANATAPSR